MPALLADTSSSNTMSPGMRYFFVALGLAGFALGSRGAMSAIHVGPVGIRVINPWSSRLLDWCEIDEFTLARWTIFPRNCVIRLSDGSTQGVWGISSRNPLVSKHDKAAEGLIAQLNARLRAERTSR
ncbi:MAG: hypothetical protein ABIW84_07970 [Ilumatobacteraceae bacterium]